MGQKSEDPGEELRAMLLKSTALSSQDTPGGAVQEIQQLGTLNRVTDVNKGLVTPTLGNIDYDPKATETKPWKPQDGKDCIRIVGYQCLPYGTIHQFGLRPPLRSLDYHRIRKA